MVKERTINITAIIVTSVGGRYTKGTGKNIYEWSSPEDFAHFSAVRSQHTLIVMGSGTFEHVKEYEQAGLKAEKGKLRIIMTENPDRYKSFTVPGQMEFTSETPQELVSRLEQAGYTKMLFVSGGKLLASFLKERLIDQLLLTIEPLLFGTGAILGDDPNLDITLQLQEMKRLNERGTLVLQYKVMH